MTASGAEFFTLNEVNRLKIIQDVVDRRWTPHSLPGFSVFPTDSIAPYAPGILRLKDALSVLIRHFTTG